MRRRTKLATQETTASPVPVSSTPSRPLVAQLLALQGQAGNRAVALALTAAAAGRQRPRSPGSPAPPVALQRKAGAYDPGEEARASGRGVLATDVSMLSAIGSGYNAAANSVVVADFPPGSAAVGGQAARELRGSWAGILERSDRPYALLGFTDSVGDEGKNQKLRADRARAVASLLPKTAKRAIVIGAAPAADFLMPGNSTPADRALNRSVLIRLPPEELRQAEQVDEYSAASVKFWRSNPASTVHDLITFVTGQAATLLDRNGVPRPDVVPGKAVTASTLAFFDAKSWTVTVDEQKLAGAAQKGVTSTTKLSALTIDGVAELASSIYHEFRHAEQSFLAARMTAEEAKGRMSPSELAQENGITVPVAGEAVAAAGTVMPDTLKAKARAWRTVQHGGRYVEYKKWNDAVNGGLSIFLEGIEWGELLKRPAGAIKQYWEIVIHPFVDKTLRRDYSFRGDALMRAMQNDPHHEPVDEQTRRNLTETASKLFIGLAKERRGKDLPGAAEIAKMDPLDAKLAHLNEQVWLQELQVALMDAQKAAEDAYRSYPNEADAYEVGEAVKTSVKGQGP